MICGWTLTYQVSGTWSLWYGIDFAHWMCLNRLSNTQSKPKEVMGLWARTFQLPTEDERRSEHKYSDKRLRYWFSTYYILQTFGPWNLYYLTKTWQVIDGASCTQCWCSCCNWSHGHCRLLKEKLTIKSSTPNRQPRLNDTMAAEDKMTEWLGSWVILAKLNPPEI